MIEAPFQSIVSRWQTFLSKVQARFHEIQQEADAGYDELMNIELIDPAVLAGAGGAFKSRVKGLQDKISEAWSKIETEMDQQIQETDDSDVCNAMYPVRDSERNRGLDSIRQMEQAADRLQMEKEAKASKMLYEIAQRDMQSLRTCHHCSAPLRIETPYKTSSVPCDHCKAVNTVHPGMATALYYQGGALHFLAQEAAWTQKEALEQVKQWYNAWRHPLESDLSLYQQAVQAYFDAYTIAMRHLHPDWTDETQQRECAARMTLWRNETASQGAEQRAHISQVLDLARTANLHDVKTWALAYRKQPDSFMEDVLEAAYEHQLVDRLPLLLEAAYQISGSSDEKTDWIQEKQDDLKRYIRTNSE